MNAKERFYGGSMMGVILLLLMTERPAHAYADPGTGALLWQMTIAVCAGCLFYLRKILFWFKRRKGPKE